MLTGIAAKLAPKLLDLAAQKPKRYWERDREGANLINQIKQLVAADARVDYSVRAQLARSLPAKLRTQPSAQGALLMLLAGEETTAASAALAQVVAVTMRDAVAWPEDFSPERFGKIVADHAVEAVDAVKASDRDAARVQHKRTREQVGQLPERIVESMLDPRRYLLPPFSEADATQSSEDGSLLGKLRASARSFPLVGRDSLMQQAAAWLREPAAKSAAGEEGSDHRVLIIHGPGGAGKTRLAGEILSLAQEDGWTAGFLASVGSESAAWSELSHPRQKLAVAIDYAETRRNDLRQLFSDAPIGQSGSAPLRVILLVREGKTQTETWATRLGGFIEISKRAEDLLSNSAVTVMSLEESLPDVADREELWSASRPRSTDEKPLSGETPPSYLDDPLFESPLYVLLDAHRELLDPSASEEVPTAASLREDVLRHEHIYWTRASEIVKVALDARQMNQIAVVATLVGGVSRSSFEAALVTIPWLAEDGSLRRRVADWWSVVYAKSSGAIRGIEPDIVGEHQIARALGESEGPRDELAESYSLEELRTLVAQAPAPARQAILRVLTRMASSRDAPWAEAAGAALSGVLARHLDELLPSTFAPVLVGEEQPSGDSLTSTVASAIVAARAFALIEPREAREEDRAPQADENGGDQARNAKLQLVRREVDHIGKREFDAGKWSSDRYLELVAWAIEIDLRSEHVERAEERVAEVADRSPRPRSILVQLYVLLGRRHEDDDRHDEAEEAYRRALAELEALDLADSVDAYIVWHDLAGVADETGDYASALELYERAYEGKAHLQGATHFDTITTLLNLLRVLAISDLDAAQDRLRAAEETLADGPEDELVRVRAFKPHLWHTRARVAELVRDWKRAERDYEAVFTALEELDEADSVFTYAVWHDLARVAAGQLRQKESVARYERALTGKQRTRDPAHPNTVTTLIALVTQMAKQDVDGALARLAKERDALAADSALEAVDRLRQHEVQLLADAGRFEQASTVASELAQERCDFEVRQAILDALSDISVDHSTPVAAAVWGAALSRRVFAVGDLRLTALASKLAQVITDVTGFLTRARMHSQHVQRLLGQIEREHETIEPAPLKTFLRSAVPNIEAVVELGVDKVRTAVAGALKDPLIASLVEASDAEPARPLSDDRALRRWLTRAACETEGQMEPNQIGWPLSLFVQARLGRQLEPPIGPAFVELWSADDSVRLAEEEGLRLQDDLAGVLGTDVGKVRHLLRAAAATMMGIAAMRAHRLEQPIELVDGLLERALTTLEQIGDGDTPEAHTLLRHRAELAAKTGDLTRAKTLLRQALDAEVRLGGVTSVGALRALLSLVRISSPEDFEQISNMLDNAVRALIDEEAPYETVDSVVDHWVKLLVQEERLQDAAEAIRGTIGWRTRRLIEEAIDTVDPTEVEGDPPRTKIATGLCLLAAGGLPAGDARVVPLANALVLVLVATSSALLSANSLTADPETPRAAGGEGSARAEAEREAQDAERAAGEALYLMGEVLSKRRRPESPTHEASSSSIPSALADDQTVRDWLARSVLADSTAQDVQIGDTVSLLSFFAALRMQIGEQQLFGGLSVGTIWSAPDIDEVARIECPRLIADLTRAGEIDATTATKLVTAARAGAMWSAGETLEEKGDWERADAGYRDALALLRDSDQSDLLLYCSISRDLGRTATQAGRDREAFDCFAEALVGLRKALGDSHPETLEVERQAREAEERLASSGET